MNKKMAVLSLLTLGVCTVAMAAEYKSPEVGFKAHAAPSKEMKVAEFGDHYKVESGMNNDRQIASEADSEREPSSVVASEKKKEMEPEKDEAVEAPKPWLFRTDENRRN
jgi:hypothetical protein